MPLNKEKDPFEVSKHLDEPWYGLRRYDGDTFRADVKPLNATQLKHLMRQLTGGDARHNFAERLRRENTSVLSSTEKVTVVLDGRAKDSNEGFLGDMIEASRMVSVIRSTGKRVIIATPHPDLFQGNHDPSISIVSIPKNIPASPTAPWEQQFLTFLNEAIGDTPCIFPMNAATPALIQLGPDGIIRNTDTLNLVKASFTTGGKNPRIRTHQWGRYGIHQLQAIQISCNLLGVEGTENWQEFPKAFFNPTQQAQEIAREVVRIYGCFESPSKDCPPIYLHPGTATNGWKLITKFYPESKWTEFIYQLAITPHATGSLTFLEPTDEQQAAMTLRLATAAIEAGLRVAKVPMTLVKQRYGWNLGSFIYFLQELSNHRGMIVGCDSMPAGHAGPATGNPAVILGSHCFDPGFYCPPQRALVILPSENAYTSSIQPNRIGTAVQSLCEDPQFQVGSLRIIGSA